MTKPPYTRYDYENDSKVRRFVKKRDRLRKLDFIVFTGGFITVIIMQRFLPVWVEFRYPNLYSVFIILWLILQMILGWYMSNKMSTCPVCHMQIHTVRTRNGHMRPGNGPLPDECPYCGTTFYDKH